MAVSTANALFRIGIVSPTLRAILFEQYGSAGEDPLSRRRACLPGWNRLQADGWITYINKCSIHDVCITHVQILIQCR
jgi:hypothetical protein